MKRALSNRVAERLRQLREKFGKGIQDCNVDDDHDHLTSTWREHVPERTFFLGEIWWADRYALGDRRPYRAGSSHCPALVTSREECPHVPVETAPSRPRFPGDAEPTHFDASAVAGLSMGTVFVLELRRPVARMDFSHHMATLDSAEKQRLARLLDALRNTRGESA